jgi:Tol biopolymer transport system component/serine/threonine protein kinase
MDPNEHKELNAGRFFGRYRVVDTLGVGGMGEVYLAEDTQLERRVAIKVLPAELAQNPERMIRFIREAKAASSLNHPHIAHIYEIGESGDGVSFIAMEYVDGVTLRDKIHRERAPLRELLKYLAQTADGLAKAHKAGVIHRDLKPDNIIISRDGYAKILDFGLAKFVEPETFIEDDRSSEANTVVMDPQLSTPGTIMGTAGYMSPEQARGLAEIDHRSDIFSFGCLLYEAATGGHQAFPGETAIDSLYGILHGQVPPIRDFNPNAPADLQRVVRRCLQKDPDDRYQTIKDVAIELREIQEEMREVSGAPLAVSPASLERGRATVADHANSSPGGHVTRPSDPAVAAGTGEHYFAPQKRSKAATAVLAMAALIILGAVGLGIYKLALTKRGAANGETAFRLIPLTSSPTVERNPALSSDGKQIAYVWTGEKNDNFDIYVKITDAGSPIRLTSSASKEMSPAWSPDGRYIAFLRGDGPEKGFYVVPALGGAERKVADSFGWAGGSVRQQAVDWSPDGKMLAVVDKEADLEPWSIYLVNVDTGERKRLTTAPADHDGDTLVAFAPDGRSLALLRRRDASTSDIYVMPVTGGEPARVTQDGVAIRGFDWASDGHRIVFSSERGGGISALWSVPVEGGPPTPVAGTGENISEINVAANRLVYAQISTDINLWRVENPLRPGAKRPAVPVKFNSSNRSEIDAAYSPDGSKVVFSSNRAGGSDIWVCDSEGLNARQLTNFGSSAVTGSPRWSPDGRSIAFDTRVGGNADIYIVGAEGGNPRRLTTETSEEMVPSWSADGKYVYFASKRAGRTEIWKMPAAGGEAVQVTKGGGFVSVESADGRLLYFTKGGGDVGLWSKDLSDGAETKVIDASVGRNWTVGERGIYFLSVPANDAEPYGVLFYDFATRRISRPEPLQGSTRTLPINVVAASPDERWFVYAQRDQLDYDILLVENFR